MNKINFLVISTPAPETKLETISGTIKDAEKGLNALRPITEYENIFADALKIFDLKANNIN